MWVNYWWGQLKKYCHITNKLLQGSKGNDIVMLPDKYLRNSYKSRKVRSISENSIHLGLSTNSGLVAQMVKNLSALRKTGIWILVWEDPLEKELATHSSIAWKIPWTEEPGRLQ